MAKEKKTKKNVKEVAKKKVEEVTTESKTIEKEVKETKKVESKPKKEKKISQRKLEIAEAKMKIEAKIDKLVKEKKAETDKAKKKELSKEIKDLKIERKEIGKRDTFLNDVRKEMSMVRWPSTGEVVKYSIACLLFVAFFALFFFGIDALFALVKDLID